jgi:hypothetical protein
MEKDPTHKGSLKSQTHRDRRQDGGGRGGVSVNWGHSFSLGDEEVLEMDGRDRCTAMCVLSADDLHAEK